MRILIVGRKIYLGQMLDHYGVESKTVETVNTPPGERASVSMVFGAWSWRRVLGSMAVLPGVKVFRIQGTDAYRMTPKTRNMLRLAQSLGAHILYAGDNLKKLVGLEGEVWATPVDTSQFKNHNGSRDVDVLYYCTSGGKDIYCVDRFMDYVKRTGESYTIIGGAVPYREMPGVYNRHRKYIRFSTHDANPKMPYEAYLCGCESWDNGREITEVPDYMRMENAIPRLIQLLEDMK